MSTFPTLKTSAVAQYPATRSFHYSTDLVQFIDGSEQRFRDYGRPYHRWIITLHRLDETELQQIRSFVVQMNGSAGVFSFTDPWDGTMYPTCSLEGDGFGDAIAGPTEGTAHIVIRENRT